jgi:hypothetical protein
MLLCYLITKSVFITYCRKCRPTSVIRMHQMHLLLRKIANTLSHLLIGGRVLVAQLVNVQARDVMVQSL